VVTANATSEKCSVRTCCGSWPAPNEFRARWVNQSAVTAARDDWN